MFRRKKSFAGLVNCFIDRSEVSASILSGSEFSYEVFDDGCSSVKAHFLYFSKELSSGIGAFFIELFEYVRFVWIKFARSCRTLLEFRCCLKIEIVLSQFS